MLAYMLFAASQVSMIFKWTKNMELGACWGPWIQSSLQKKNANFLPFFYCKLSLIYSTNGKFGCFGTLGSYHPFETIPASFFGGIPA